MKYSGPRVQTNCQHAFSVSFFVKIYNFCTNVNPAIHSILMACSTHLTPSVSKGLSKPRQKAFY